MSVWRYIYRISCHIPIDSIKGYHLSSAEAPASYQVQIISLRPAQTRPSLKIWKEPERKVSFLISRQRGGGLDLDEDGRIEPYVDFTPFYRLIGDQI